jgi:DNA-binding protein HU-beta
VPFIGQTDYYFVEEFTMNKTKLIEVMAKMSKLPKTACKKALESYIDAIAKSLKGGKKISITGFGTYMVMQRQARWGVNPATGEKMKIKAKRVAKFKPGKSLRDLVA